MLAPIENVLKSLMTKSLPKGAVVIGDGLRRLVDRLEGCLAAFSPLPEKLVESVADVLKFGLKFVLKTEPKGMDDNDGGIGSGLSWKGGGNGIRPGTAIGAGTRVRAEIRARAGRKHGTGIRAVAHDLGKGLAGTRAVALGMDLGSKHSSDQHWVLRLDPP